jgi:SAM-dependent methyltransferase
MDSKTASILREADDYAQRGEIAKMFLSLRDLDLKAFAYLMLSPPPEYSGLALTLPTMAPEETQRNWTGSHGELLLKQSIEFVQMMESGYLRHVGNKMQDVDVLDFGCGWGRLIRLLYRYTPPEKLYGVDPWEASLEFCRQSRLFGNFELSNYVPRELPFGSRKFSLIYAFSVFTHLSPKTTSITQETLRSRIAEDGLLVVTIRPEAYWNHQVYWPEGCTPEKMIDQHRSQGIAFIPHNRPPIEGEVTYGDTSMSPEYLRQNWKGWTIVESHPLIQDPMQVVTFLKPQ